MEYTPLSGVTAEAGVERGEPTQSFASLSLGPWKKKIQKSLNAIFTFFSLSFSRKKAEIAIALTFCCVLLLHGNRIVTIDC